MNLNALQSAVLSRLEASTALMLIAKAIWIPRAPQAADGQVESPFPYLALPQVNLSPFDTAGSLGTNAVVQVDGYSRKGGDATEINALHDAVYGVLHRGSLVIPGVTWVTTEYEAGSFGYEDQGETRRFVALYRVTYQAV